ncbi:MAG TPA: histidinol phosphatase, partial [Ferruginibacter sp.]|nr:histidinol phosphatase [Ferruginibacter sp.]
MFHFFKKKKTVAETYDHLPVTTDIHSHVLPGIDDGSPDMETSLLLIRGMRQLGIRRFIATPHIIGDMYRNTPETIRTALEETRAACKKAGIDVQLDAAAEYMIDDHFLELLKNKS